MAVNVYRPHVIVLPEDDADRAIVTGFEKQRGINLRAIQVMPPAQGWTRVRDQLKYEYVPRLQKYSNMHLVLVVDFDDAPTRRADVLGDLDPGLCERVFVIGALSNPEQLRRQFGGNFEEIGGILFGECNDGRAELWTHRLLQHNATEVVRLRTAVLPILLGR